MKKLLFIAALAATICGCNSGTVRIASVSRTDTSDANPFYESSRKPLAPQQFIKLPMGSVTPGGWLAKQIDLQKEGLFGQLPVVSAFLQKDDNAWLKQGGSWGWEEVPYWLRGYAATAYVTRDPEMLAETQTWIEAIFASQKQDGNFGPGARDAGHPEWEPVGRSVHQDFWPNMLALWIIQDYYEFSGDNRALEFLTRYCRFLETVPDDEFLESYWENSRGGDNLWSVVWLYNRTGDSFLLGLADKIHRNTADWTRSDVLPNWHNVNIAQCFREPATYYVFNRDSSLLKASYNDFNLVRRIFGQVPGGMFGADENARQGYIDPRQGTETCGFAEQMASDEIMTLISGDPLWAENCEDIAFNSFPAAFLPDYKALRYITCPNQAISNSKDHHPGIDNSGPFMSMNPLSSRCCQHNHGFAWPYYSQHLMMATPDKGAAAVLYCRCSADIKVGDGTSITIEESTDYPFGENIEFTIRTPHTVHFPLYLRIPSWCGKASVRRNGRRIDSGLEPGTYARIDGEWNDGDRISLELPMELTWRNWPTNRHSVSVNYGPLTLSLEIMEEYRATGAEHSAEWDSRWPANVNPADWPAYDIFPSTAWNYALATDSPITIERSEWPADDNPFTLDNVPLRFKAKGRLIPGWNVDEYSLTGLLPAEDEPKLNRVDDITLVPMGAARLRISAFPACTVR